MHVKKGQTVEVIRGAHKGKTGVIAKAIPKANQVIVAGVNLKKKHVKPTRNTKGKTIEIAHPLSVSNVRPTEKVKKEKAPKVEKPKSAKKDTKKAQ
jgi:large subunit ribosomal protein L24